MPHIEGTEVHEEELHNLKVTTFQIQTEQAAEQLKRPIGSYITIKTGAPLNAHDRIEDVGECLAEVLGRVMQPYYQGKLIICGLGNRANPADALGPEVTRNLPLNFLSDYGEVGNFREVCSFAPGTPFNNNMDTEVIVNGVTRAVGADCVLLVDSLAAQTPSRLFQTIQISSAGGTQSYCLDRKDDWSALGVPVISLGMPMTLPLSILTLNQEQSGDMLTSVEVQDMIASAGRIIAYAILRMCWPAKSKIECFVLIPFFKGG